MGDPCVSSSHTEYTPSLTTPIYIDALIHGVKTNKYKNADMEAPVHNNDNDKREGRSTKTMNMNLRAASPRR